MGDLFFAARMAILTVALIFIMQIRIGTATIEQHSLAWMHDSAMIENLRAIAEGGVKAASQGYRWITSSFEIRTNHEQ